jgi:hypothetical protein
VSFFVNLFEPLGGDVSVDLSGDEMGVAEKFLHAAKVRPGVEQMSGVAVTQFVGSEFWIEAGEREVFF